MEKQPRTARGRATRERIVRAAAELVACLVANRPQAFQLDGDYLGERQKGHFVSVPEALRVIC